MFVLVGSVLSSKQQRCGYFSGEKDDLKKSESQRQRREDQLAHLNADITAPLSPAPSSSEQSVSSLARQDSVASTPGAAVSSPLPHDVQKFLKFAG